MFYLIERVVFFILVLLFSCDSRSKESTHTNYSCTPTQSRFSSTVSSKENKNTPLVKFEKSYFGTTAQGDDIDQYILINKKGMKISVINYGGIITSWTARDKNGRYEDIVLGYNTLEEYENQVPYFGALIGRYANRIAKGKFKVEGKDYVLNLNNQSNHLHGGIKGFDKVIWNSKTIVSDSTVSLVLTYLSEDMEEGYPGNLKTKVTYTLNNKDEFRVKYEAVTDKPTIVNLTQHSYFNLSGDFDKTILNHKIVINADSYLPVNNSLIPTGELKNVSDTPFDFREPKFVGQHINNNHSQLKIGSGYDHCWVLNDQEKGLRFIASAYEPNTGRFLEVFSDKPGIQFYSGNFLEDTHTSKNKKPYKKHAGLCLETQYFPDTPNNKSFPSAILRSGEKYETETIFKLSHK